MIADDALARLAGLVQREGQEWRALPVKTPVPAPAKLQAEVAAILQMLEAKNAS